MSNFVDFGDGFAANLQQSVNELQKALTAGAGYSGAPTSLTGGGALQVESLDGSLKSVTYEMKNLKLWPVLAKDQAYNTIEEYNRQDAFGDQGRGFIAEGGLPRSEDSSYSRQIERIRFVGVTRQVSHVYTLVRNAHGDAVAREIRNGTMRILEIVERAMFDGRGYYSNDGVFDGATAAILADESSGDLAWNGADKQIRAGDSDPTAKAKAFTGYGQEESVVMNLRGDVPDEDALEDGARIIGDNFGAPNRFMSDTKTISDISRQFYPKERINNMGVANGKAGFTLKSFVSGAGEFELVGNVFQRPKRRPSDAMHATTPAKPTATAASNSQSGESKWTAADAGDYIYLVSAVLAEDGEGALSTAADAETVAAGQQVTVAIAATTGAMAYAVYRSTKGGAASTAEFIGYVAPATVGGAADFIDLNHKLPGLAQAYLFTNEAENMRFKQLAPLMKMDLARIATSERWMQLLYGAPIFYTPRKNVIFENIGRAV